MALKDFKKRWSGTGREEAGVAAVGGAQAGALLASDKDWGQGAAGRKWSSWMTDEQYGFMPRMRVRLPFVLTPFVILVLPRRLGCEDE